MGWGERHVPEGPRLSPSQAAAVLNLAAAVRRWLARPSTGNEQHVRDALERHDREVRL
jgi:hypothetical protein